MPVENWLIVPLRIVTFVCPPVRTPTLSSCGSGHVWGPIPGPVIVWPPRSSVTLSALITNASVVQVISLARTKSVLMRCPHCAFCGTTLRAGVAVGVPDALAAAVEAVGEAWACGPVAWQATAVMTSSAMPAALTRISAAYTTASRAGSRDTLVVREEAPRIDARLEGTLRVPDAEPRGIVVIAHPLPTHGGEMRNPLVAGIARACAERGWDALRVNVRSCGASVGTWTGGREEEDDVGAAVAHARGVAPTLPLGLVGYS